MTDAGIDMEGRVAVVTGGGSGMGRATAIALAAAGARVVIADMDMEAATAVAQQLGENGLAVHADVSTQEANATMVAQAVDTFGALDLAYLNAGILGAPSSILNGDVSTWDKVMSVNLRGVFLGLRAVAPAMIQAGRGSVVVTASLAGLRGDLGMPSYVASKHGVIGLVKAAAAELSEYGIRVNAVCPGAIDTPMVQGTSRDRASLLNALSRLHPLGRVGQAGEVAELVKFLMSDNAGFITGGSFPVDGGASAVNGPLQRPPQGR